MADDGHVGSSPGSRPVLAADRRGDDVFRTVVDSMAEGALYLDASGRIVLCNPAAEGILGLDAARMVGQRTGNTSWDEIQEDGSPFAPEDLPAARSLRTGEPVQGTRVGIRRPDGVRRWLRVNARPLHDGQGRLKGVVVTFDDVTDRRRQDLVAAARLRLLARAPELSIRAFLTATLDEAEALTGSRIGFFHFVDADETGLELQAWSTNTMARTCTAKGAGSHYPVDRAGVWADSVRQRRPVIHNDYASLPHRKGMPEGHAPVTREISVPVVRGGRVVAVLGVGNRATDYRDDDVEVVHRLADLAWDIAGRKRAEEELRRSELLHRALAHHFPRGVVGLFGLDLRLILVDGEQVHLAREPAEMVGRSPREIAPGPKGEQLEELFREALAGRSGRGEIAVRDRTVEVVTHPIRDAGGEVIMGMVVTQDVTEERALQARLQSASRLAALGTLVAGVAHEINNPLAAELAAQDSAVAGVQELAQRLRGADDVEGTRSARDLEAVLEALADAQAGGRRIARIVKDLSVFGRQDPRRTRVRIGDVVEQGMRWLPSSASRDVKLQLELGATPEVIASEGQLVQVLVNLVTNALQAVPGGRRGTVVIRTGTAPAGAAFLEVRDDGAGIDPRVMERIFDPFFTTREVGQGMGLGLPICHAIVTSHGGTLAATSTEGAGSTFRVELPAAAEAARVPAPA